MITKIVLNILKGLNRKINSTSWRDLRSTTPISDVLSYDRGNQSVHRYYIDRYIDSHADKIRGSVLEVGDRMYMDRYAGAIGKTSVIHFQQTSVKDAFQGDLTNLATLPEAAFDCFICTQTFNFIYDFQAAIRGAKYMLKDDGYLIATVSGIQQVSQFDASRWGDYWRFTKQSCLRSFGEVFGEENVVVTAYGNVLAGIASLEGLSSSELKPQELDYHDPSYELVLGIVARKSKHS